MDTCDPHPIHVNEGWTRFLEKCAPVDFLDEIEPKTEQRVEYRKKLLSDVYMIAQWEQDFQEFGMGESRLRSCNLPYRPLIDTLQTVNIIMSVTKS